MYSIIFETDLFVLIRILWYGWIRILNCSISDFCAGTRVEKNNTIKTKICLNIYNKVSFGQEMVGGENDKTQEKTGKNQWEESPCL